MELWAQRLIFMELATSYKLAWPHHDLQYRP
jgi:hypothetical protein